MDKHTPEPCPICGREVSVKQEWGNPIGLPSVQDLIDKKPPYGYSITCNDGDEHKHVVTVTGKTEAEVVERWNTRFLASQLATVTEERDKLREFVEQAEEWSRAYTTDIFPEPTPEQVDAVCAQLGFRIDRIAAMVLRDYSKRWGEKAREALAATAPSEAAVCLWTEEGNGYEGEGVWHTRCGETFVYNDGTPAENGARFCQYCGKRLEYQQYVPEPEEDDEAIEPPKGGQLGAPLPEGYDE